jgi:hypothetical protein
MKVLQHDSAALASTILGSDRLIAKHREVIKLWCDWRGIKHDPKSQLLQIGRTYTTSDFWESEKDALLEDDPELEDKVAELFEMMEDSLITEDECFQRIDLLTEPLLPTILDDWRMWLPRASCYTSALFALDVAEELYPDRKWSLTLSENDLHAFVYCEETDEAFDLLLEYTKSHHSVGRVFREAMDYVTYIYELMDKEAA